MIFLAFALLLININPQPKKRYSMPKPKQAKQSDTPDFSATLEIAGVKVPLSFEDLEYVVSRLADRGNGELIEVLARHPSRQLRSNVAGSTLTEKAFNEIAENETSDEVLRNLVDGEHPNFLTDAHINLFLNRETVLEHVAYRLDRLDPEKVDIPKWEELLSDHQSPEVRRGLVGGTDNWKILKKLAKDSDPLVAYEAKEKMKNLR